MTFICVFSSSSDFVQIVTVWQKVEQTEHYIISNPIFLIFHVRSNMDGFSRLTSHNFVETALIESQFWFPLFKKLQVVIMNDTDKAKREETCRSNKEENEQALILILPCSKSAHLHALLILAVQLVRSRRWFSKTGVASFLLTINNNWIKII